MYEITTTASFSAAHHLRNYNGPCENVHGHNWLVKATVQCNKLNECGIGIDFKDLKGRLKEILATLDHTDLNNELAGKIDNPSSELLARYIYAELSKVLIGCKVKRIEVYETPENCAAYFE